jgi:hypothetical protein
MDDDKKLTQKRDRKKERKKKKRCTMEPLESTANEESRKAPIVLMMVPLLNATL